MSEQSHDPAKPGTSEKYLRLLKGEISSKQFVKTVQKKTGRRATKRSARRAVAQ